jgi:flagellar assembly protein FliH
MATRPATNRLPINPVVDTSSTGVSVRPAQLDRPLRRTALDPRYTDPHLEELVRVAAERARDAARAEGYAVGWSQGRQAADERAKADSETAVQLAEDDRAGARLEIAKLLTTLAKAARAAQVNTGMEWLEVADVLADGAMRLATAALGRELHSIDDPIIQAVKGALHQLNDPGEAVVHLNPADAAQLADGEALAVRVIPDPDVPLGSVVVLTPAQRLRHNLPAALAAAEEVLRS